MDRAWLTPGRFAHDRRCKLYDEKYAESNPKAGQLYDLLADPDETHPIEIVAETPEQRDAREMLKHVLDNIDSGVLKLGDT